MLTSRIPYRYGARLLCFSFFSSTFYLPSYRFAISVFGAIWCNHQMIFSGWQPSYCFNLFEISTQKNGKFLLSMPFFFCIRCCFQQLFFRMNGLHRCIYVYDYPNVFLYMKCICNFISATEMSEIGTGNNSFINIKVDGPFPFYLFSVGDSTFNTVYQYWSMCLCVRCVFK